MAEGVADLNLRAKFSDDESLKYREGRLFLGVLGIEYSVPYFAHLNTPQTTISMQDLSATSNPPPPSLHFSFLKRTANPEEFAYSDGILPVYLRFQPDLRAPLYDASQGDAACGTNYMQQKLQIEQPIVMVEGKIAQHNADGSVTYPDRTLKFEIPVNPPSRRVVELSLQAGLIVFLAEVR